MIGVGRALHLHVHAGRDRLHGHVGQVLRVAVADHLGHRVPVAHDEALEAPLVAQHLAQQEPAARGGNAVDLVERGHHRRDAGVHRGLEGRQVDVAQQALRDPRGVVVAAALRRAVARVVLRAGGDAVRRAVVVALEAADHRRGQHGREVRVLAEALGDPAPARVARDVHHRRERPVEAGRGRLLGGDGRAVRHQLRVPRRGLGERDREDRAVAVDHVAAHQQRDAEPALLDRDALDLQARGRHDLVQHRAEPALAQALLERVGYLAARGVDLHELADLLGERHAGQQLVHATLDVALRGRGGGGQGKDHRGGAGSLHCPAFFKGRCRKTSVPRDGRGAQRTTSGSGGAAFGEAVRKSCPRSAATVAASWDCVPSTPSRTPSAGVRGPITAIQIDSAAGTFSP